jgi:outer membrane lipoprotein-sorting protein
MKNKLLSAVLSAIFIFLLIGLAGCGKKNRTPEEITCYLKDLNSYSSIVNMHIKNDRQTIDYELKQYYQKDLGYRLELGQDRIMVYKDDKIYINDLKSGFKYNTDKNFDELFRLSFIGEYIELLYTNEKIKYKNKKLEGIDYLSIELLIPGGNKNIDNAVLYINTDTNLPSRLYIFDVKGNEKVEVIYKDFIPNDEVKKDLFKIE